MILIYYQNTVYLYLELDNILHLGMKGSENDL